MINCIVIDDEKPAREEIIFHIKKNNELKFINDFDNGEDAIDFMKEETIDLIFLDINMPNLDGIEFTEKIKNIFYNPPKIIFITAYEHYAVKAFELNATDYILKPVRKQRFIKAVTSAIEAIEANKDKSKSRFISLSKNGELYPILKDNIKLVYIENREVFVNTTTGNFTANCTLNHFEHKLRDKCFFRAHRSYIININYIEKIIPWFNSTYKVKLEDVDKEIPISRSKTPKFKEKMSII